MWKSSCPEVLCKKVFFNISQNSQGNACARVPSLTKVVGPCNFNKKAKTFFLQHSEGCFSMCCYFWDTKLANNLGLKKVLLTPFLAILSNLNILLSFVESSGLQSLWNYLGAYLGPSQTSAIELPCKNSLRPFTVNYFRKKFPSWTLNTKWYWIRLYYFSLIKS